MGDVTHVVCPACTAANRTLVIFKDGREIARRSGAMDAGALFNWMRSRL